ncbi:MAG: glycosyltransferase family 4 protein [Bacteroidia bacterium]
MAITSDFPLRTSHFNIGFDAKRAFNNGTGLGNYSRFVIRSLAKYFPENEYYLFTPSIKKEFENFIPASSNIKIISPESILGKTFPSLWRTYSIAEMCNELKLDVFHGLSNELPVGIEKFNGKKIVTIHDLIFLRYPDYYTNIDRYIYKNKFRHACEKADIICAASIQTKKEIIHFFSIDEHKIRVTYQNCDDRFSNPPDEKVRNEVIKKYLLLPKYILCLGTIEKRKNQHTVLKAFSQLDEPELKLIFIGKETDYSDQLHDFIELNRLESKVIFIPQIEIEFLPAFYRQAQAFVYASEFEGFGIPLLEAMRSGVPVIAANTSSLPEVCGDAAEYFSFNISSELARKMKLVLQDESKRIEMIVKGFEQAKKFDSEILMKELMGIYLKK